MSDFNRIDAVKWNFFKMVLGVHQNTRNRLIILATGLSSLTDDFIRKGFPLTPAYIEYVSELEDKLADIDVDIFETPLFKTSSWKNPSNSKRSIISRASFHGFHSVLCNKGICYLRESSCVCLHCNSSASSLLHCLSCPGIPSLSFLDSL